MNVIARAVAVGMVALPLSAWGDGWSDLSRLFDTREPFPPFQPFGKSDTTLPGTVPADLKALNGMFYARNIQEGVEIETRREPRLFSGFFLELSQDGSYELNYLAYWGARSPSDPRHNSVQVKEKGKASLSGEVLLLEPQSTLFTRNTGGKRGKPETIENTSHAYLVRNDKKFLNIAGRCAKYQVEPLCKEAPSVWMSMLFTTDRQIMGMPGR